MQPKTELGDATEELERAMRAFKQNPTPSMGSVVKRLANRVKYLRRGGKEAERCD